MVKSKLRFPEEGDFVVGKVAHIERDHVYIDILDYEGNDDEEYARGMIHISEITSRWVKNIRNYVRLNQIVVLKVLRVNEAKGQVDVSLRRVSAQQRKLKMKDHKYGVKYENLLSFLAEESGKSLKEVYETIGWPLLEKYGLSVQKTLEKIKENGAVALEDLNLDPDIIEKFVKIVNENVEISTVWLSGTLSLSSNNPDGINDIKRALKAGLDVIQSPKETKKVDFRYIAAPKYKLEVVAKNYQKGEAILAEVLQAIEREMTKVEGTFEFSKDK
jgi:translation initiation factor 2 subunit 1